MKKALLILFAALALGVLALPQVAPTYELELVTEVSYDDGRSFNAISTNRYRAWDPTTQFRLRIQKVKTP
jgi:hypothetical protein